MGDDVWVKRITAIFDGLQKLIVAIAAIYAAWQSTQNGNHIKMLGEKQDRQIVMMGAK